MLFNKKKRIQYLGFDDKWFILIGIIVLSFVTDFLFNNSFARYPFQYAVINWSVSLFFTLCNWFVIRSIIILLRKRYPGLENDVKRTLLLLLSIICTVISIDFLGNNLLSYIFDKNYKPLSSSQVLLPVIIISTMTMAIYEAIYYNIRLKKSIREEEQAKQAIVQAQLDALRNQAQPHFLFNTLNTLRDIIDQNSKEEAKEFVNKISDVYRFILESGSVDLISLRNELRFARAYIHIQSERFGDNLKLHWSIPESSMERMIVPMSLQLLLENAIKHNIISKANPLIIGVSVADDHLIVTNDIRPKSTITSSTKLGLQNIERRYALIADSAIKIANDGERFVVSLPLLKTNQQKKAYAGTDH
ncbi:sensor histidine kinase [Sungkyunkwania multivorans]|uniref:Sensor histidine kinase n=1 Tax=Sungkyunkwania multivorans TaxID=1173618 RepID=A0ABW3CYZ6_9FLAO